MKIDLKELAVRESEHVEWKENVADIQEVIATIVAFANDYSNLGGGYVVCGGKEDKDSHGFQKLLLTGLTSDRCKELEGKVLNDCREKVDPPIVPVVDEQPADSPDRRVLIFIVPASPHAHNYRGSGKDASTYYIRIGRETREARNGLLRELLLQKNALESWDRRVNHDAGPADIDLLALRDALQQMGLWEPHKSLEDYLSTESRLSSFVPPLAGKVSMTGQTKPRNFTLLLFGSEPTRFFSGAYSIFSIYRGRDRSEPTAERVQLAGTVISQARRLIELLNTESYTAFDKTSSEAPNQVKYPIRALQEAVVNALVHRDYESDQPSRITVFSDRIEINSPGGLPRTIQPEKFKAGRASAFWRNQTLAYFFNKLQLAQAEGQGIPTILRTMRDEGCPNPVFDLTSDNVTCVLPAHPRHGMLRELSDIENKIILGQRDEALKKLEVLLDSDPINFRFLELYCEINSLLKTPERVFAFVKAKKIVPGQISPGTAIVMARTLAQVPNSDSQKIAREWLNYASSARLEAAEIKRIALNFRKLGNDEEAIKIIDDYHTRAPGSPSNSALLDIRAKAKIDLAKKCMDTARTPQTPPRLRAIAWEQCRKYLDQAEADLRKALEVVTSSIDREYVEKDLEFLKTMRDFARKPGPRQTRKASPRRF